MTGRLEKALAMREKNGTLRQLVDFASNDYLGLARSSTGSRLLTGNSVYAENLEDEIAAFHGFEAGLLFNCGYMANIGLLSTVACEDDCVIFDAHIHASTRDGIQLSKAAAFPFRHNNLESLENRLKACTVKGERFICIESIYSMDGSIAPLQEMCLLAKKYEAHLIVDEAHAVGVYGPQGRGLLAKENLCSEVFAQVTTFGKALGAHGAIVLGSQTLKHSLINFAKSFIYTTALPMHSLVAIKNSYDLFPGMDAERKHLQKLGPSIQAIPVKDPKAVAEKIRHAGFDVRPILSPTVRRGHEILRLCLHAFNTEAELKALYEVIYG